MNTHHFSFVVAPKSIHVALSRSGLIAFHFVNPMGSWELHLLVARLGDDLVGVEGSPHQDGIVGVMSVYYYKSNLCPHRFPTFA